MTPGTRGMTGKHGHHRRGPRVEGVIITCEICGTKRRYAPSQLRVRKQIRFCSIACRAKGQIVARPLCEPATVPCAQCGRATPKRKNRAQSFCSAKCSGASRRVEGAKWRDPEQIRAYMREYTQRHRAEHNAQGRLWARQHRGNRNQLQRARRASGKAADFSEQDWLELKRRYGWKCLACGRPESLLVVLQPDHVIAVARGGPHTVANIQPLCGSCNATKGAKTIDYRPAEQAQLT